MTQLPGVTGVTTPAAVTVQIEVSALVWLSAPVEAPMLAKVTVEPYGVVVTGVLNVSEA
jgi:hypothetical protein